jgi:hypothetical protein
MKAISKIALALFGSGSLVRPKKHPRDHRAARLGDPMSLPNYAFKPPLIYLDFAHKEFSMTYFRLDQRIDLGNNPDEMRLESRVIQQANDFDVHDPLDGLATGCEEPYARQFIEAKMAEFGAVTHVVKRDTNMGLQDDKLQVVPIKHTKVVFFEIDDDKAPLVKMFLQ